MRIPATADKSVDAQKDIMVESPLIKPDLSKLMRQALMEAEKGFYKGEVPVGAVLVDEQGCIIAKGHNQTIVQHDPTAHAEILVMRKAGLLCRNYRLTNTVLVVTIEPCLMCMGAMLNARIAHLVFGAFDPKAGAAGSLYNLPEDKRLNHRIEITSGIMETECRDLMQSFFKLRRKELD
jgi:tRNA(adenine34) deaminase